MKAQWILWRKLLAYHVKLYIDTQSTKYVESVKVWWTFKKQYIWVGDTRKLRHFLSVWLTALRYSTDHLFYCSIEFFWNHHNFTSQCILNDGQECKIFATWETSFLNAMKIPRTLTLCRFCYAVGYCMLIAELLL